MNQKHVISFIEGMDKDTSFNKYPNTRYLHSENFRFIYDEENSMGILTNDVGNKKILNLGGTLLGYTTLRNSLVLFTLDSTNLLEIYQVPESNIFDNNLDINSFKKLRKDFGYTSDTVIRALGRYESELVQKIYWIDEIGLKYCNLADPNIITYALSKFDSFPEFNLGTITVENTISGSIPIGLVQYAYQLYNINGSTSLVSSLSDVVVMISDSFSQDSKNIKGNNPGESSGKGNIVTITGLDTNYDRIKLYRLQYTDIVQQPEVFLVDDTVFGKESITIIDSSSIGVGQIAFENIIFTRADLSPSTIETKNNLLFSGNVTEKVFDINPEITLTDATTGDVTIIVPTNPGGSGTFETDIIDDPTVDNDANE